jgi:hypothetical protein
LKDVTHFGYFQLFSDVSFSFKDLLSKFHFKLFRKKNIFIFINSSFNHFEFQNILFSDNENVLWNYCFVIVNELKLSIIIIYKNSKECVFKEVWPKLTAWQFSHLPLIYWPHAFMKVSWLFIKSQAKARQTLWHPWSILILISILLYYIYIPQSIEVLDELGHFIQIKVISNENKLPSAYL